MGFSPITAPSTRVCAFIEWFKLEQPFHAFRATESSPVQHTEMLGILLNFVLFANLIKIIPNAWNVA